MSKERQVGGDEEEEVQDKGDGESQLALGRVGEAIARARSTARAAGCGIWRDRRLRDGGAVIWMGGR